MTRPSDIPQWAWDEAVDLLGWRGKALNAYDRTKVEKLARALLSAYERGRGERDSEIVEALNERDMFINPEMFTQAADEIDCCDVGFSCDQCWHEYDTNASGCHASERGDYCPNDVAETLRAVGKIAQKRKEAT